MQQIVPKELLEKSDKILFIGGVAIGDFAYLHNYFKALSEQYPNLKIDLWNDEYRGKSRLLRWKNEKHDIVHEWLESCPFFNKIYKNIGAWWNMSKFFKQLRQENYPIVVCLFNIRPSRTAKFAKLISPSGFIVPVLKTVEVDFVSDSFGYIFKRNFGVEISNNQKKVSFEIDKKWMDDARTKLLEKGIHPKPDSLIFLNSFAKNKKRCWDTNNVIELINRLKAENIFSNLCFIINTLPDKKKYIEELIKESKLDRVYVFTASKSFFELPAMISLCDLVISVDTSVVHLAFALNIPLVGLLRQQNIVWAPRSEKSFFVFTKNKKDWVSKISINDVINRVRELNQKLLS